MAVLDISGWSSTISEAFDAVGGLAASVKTLFTKKTTEEKAQQAAITEAQRAAIVQAQLAQQKQSLSKTESFMDIQKLKALAIKYWYVLVIVGFILLKNPIMRMLGLKKKVGNRRYKRTPVKTVVKRTRSGVQVKTKVRNPSLTVNGRRFSSMSAKMKYLRSLRKK